MKFHTYTNISTTKISTLVIHIIGGGTLFHVRPHLAISAIAYGSTAKIIGKECSKLFNSSQFKIETHLTSMATAGKSGIETNSDVEELLLKICADKSSLIIFLPVALCDFEGYVIEDDYISKSGKDLPRLKSRKGRYQLQLIKADKLISSIKKLRPDILLIGFKTTSDVSEKETIKLACQLKADTKCDFVFANDIHRRINLIVGENNFISEVYKKREEALKFLVRLVHEKALFFC